MNDWLAGYLAVLFNYSVLGTTGAATAAHEGRTKDVLGLAVDRPSVTTLIAARAAGYWCLREESRGDKGGGKSRPGPNSRLQTSKDGSCLQLPRIPRP